MVCQAKRYLAVILILALPVGQSWGESVITAPTDPEICFPLPDGERMLKDLEALPVCRNAVKAGEDAINSNKIRAKALEDRIAEQDREIASGKKTIEDTRKAGEEAAKIAAGPWYTKVLSAAKWIGLGIVIGFVGGMAK